MRQVDKEKWKDIPGYEGLYKISTHGRVSGINGKHSFGWNVNDGYRKVRLYKNGLRKDFYVHRLVALSFVKMKNGFSVINHKDSNPSNNHYKNLEWCTQTMNMKHAAEKGRLNVIGKCVIQKSTGIEFISIKKAAESIGINQNTLVHSLRKGSSKYGFMLKNAK